MGAETFANLRTEGGVLAGDDTLDASVALKVKRWLREQAASWPWPVLMDRYSALALPQGATSLTVGGGIGSVKDKTGATVTAGEIHEIKAPILVYDSVYGTQQSAAVLSLANGDPTRDETIFDPTKNQGTPQRFKVRRASTNGQWFLFPTPVPDRAYLLALDVRVIPADPADNATLWYPNDETTIAAIVAFVNEYADGVDQKTAQAALARVAAMVRDDRFRYGKVDGTNDQNVLDSSVFL